MIKCPNCGAEWPNEAAICGRCNSVLLSVDTTRPSTASKSRVPGGANLIVTLVPLGVVLNIFFLYIIMVFSLALPRATLAEVLPLSILVAAAPGMLLVFGLLRRRSWGWNLGMVYFGVSAIFGLVALAATGAVIVSLAVDIIILGFLALPENRTFFAPSPAAKTAPQDARA